MLKLPSQGILTMNPEGPDENASTSLYYFKRPRGPSTCRMIPFADHSAALRMTKWAAALPFNTSQSSQTTSHQGSHRRPARHQFLLRTSALLRSPASLNPRTECVLLLRTHRQTPSLPPRE